MYSKRGNYLSSIFIFTLIFHYGNLKSHNFINGGCKNHCFSEENYLIDNNLKLIDQINNNIHSSSCLNSHLCRG